LGTAMSSWLLVWSPGRVKGGLDPHRILDSCCQRTSWTKLVQCSELRTLTWLDLWLGGRCCTRRQDTRAKYSEANT
jgi:hypothetical protein